jgi:hypothetical protein
MMPGHPELGLNKIEELLEAKIAYGTTLAVFIMDDIFCHIQCMIHRKHLANEKWCR